MKTKLALLAGLIIVLTVTGNAQQKIGYVDSDAIMSQLPDAQDAQKQIDAQIKEWQEELDKMEKNWKSKYDDYQNRKLTMSNHKRAETEKELMSMEEKIRDYRQKKFGAKGELFKLQEDIMKPIQNKIFAAIQKVADEEDFDYVFDRSGDVIFLYTKDKWDLTPLVIEKIKELGNANN
jgi:outer membrane protein